MQRILTFVFLIVFATGIQILAEDVLVLRNGDIINGLVTEITSSEVKYKKASNPNGPIYSIDKDEVLSIKYENGETDKFEPSNSSSNALKTNSNNGVARQKASPASDNKDEIERYASLPRFNLKTSSKKSKSFIPIMAFTDSSVISTNELTIMIDPQAVEYFDGGWKVKIGYSILIINKTDNPIYIDRANCFRRYNNMDTKSYFDNKQTTVSHGNSSSASIGIGLGSVGIGVGGSSSSSHSENYGVDRFLLIGPHSKANLTDYEYIRLSEKKTEFKTVSDIEYWGFDLSSDDPVNEGGVQTYTAETTPYSNTYYITYSDNQDFSNIYTLEFELYAKYLIGGKMKQDKWSMMSPETNIVNEYKKTFPDFWTDGLSIIGIQGEYTK